MFEKSILRIIFGKVEIETILKKIQRKKLKQTERNYLSKSIRPKLRAINLIAQLNLLEKINKPKEKITTEEIIYNLSRFGYDLITIKKIKAQKKYSLEELIIKILTIHPQPRFIEAIPIILLKNEIDQLKLLELTTKHHLKNEIGYLIETALMIKKKEELKCLFNYLQKTKEKEKKFLGEEPTKEYREFILKNSPPRIKSWNLFGRFFDQDFKRLARGYL
ncbi:MAG: hypothetical protein ABH824_01995 [Nanoarchaeota archaeon]|nr:hypothetical protein [Nanoarchaeota archaeon]MBU1632209.1 hypothetical protein [Nanoarchaeota archaeon]MBU1876378.1 hypothetical protein [Nanoarchaeota archaeon]